MPMRRGPMPVPDCGRSRGRAEPGRSSPLLLGLLREPLIDAGEVGVFVVAVEGSQTGGAAPLHFVRHGGIVVTLDESRQLRERPFAELDCVSLGSRALLATVVAARSVDVAKFADQPLAQVAEATLPCDRRFERELRSVKLIDMTRQRRLAGLVVVDHDRAVFADVATVGPSGQVQAGVKISSAVYLGVCACGEGPSPRLGRGEPGGELMEGRPPEGLDAGRATELGESLVCETDQLDIDVRRQGVGIGFSKVMQS